MLFRNKCTRKAITYRARRLSEGVETNSYTMVLLQSDAIPTLHHRKVENFLEPS